MSIIQLGEVSVDHWSGSTRSEERREVRDEDEHSEANNT